MSNKYSKEQKELVLKMVAEGIKPITIEKIVGVTVPTIYRWKSEQKTDNAKLMSYTEALDFLYEEIHDIKKHLNML